MKLKNIFKFLLGKITNCYNYGRNNKVIFIKNGKETSKFFMPKGLKILFEGNNSVVKIEKPLKFENVLIYLEADNGIFSIKHSHYKVKDAKFYIEKNSQILIGENCQLKSSNLTMIANCSYKEPAIISIKNNVFIGPNAIIRTSDGHTLIDAQTKEPLNETKNVNIEDNVWIGSNCTILKGACISKGSVVGACSMVNKEFKEENVLIAGIPAKILKHNITWDKKGFGRYKRDFKKEN